MTRSTAGLVLLAGVATVVFGWATGAEVVRTPGDGRVTVTFVRADRAA